MSRELPEIIQQVGFDFHWDAHKVWAIEAPVEDMRLDELAWHFDVPFLWKRPNGYYDVLPRDVLDRPDQHALEYARTMQADTSYPIDIMRHNGRWVILDGLHRLMKLSAEGATIVKVRKIPVAAIPLIAKDAAD